MDPLALLFWTALFGATYSYFLYPLALLAVAGRAPPPPAAPTVWPRLSLIITAYNEAARIRQKIDNTLALDYPPDRLEVIVASDGSVDETDAIVRGFMEAGVRLVRPAERRGKEHAQACAIAEAEGDILVFSDVATTLPAGALKAIATRMQDPAVGAVSSEDRFVSSDGRLVGEGAYVRYEMWLRRLESRAAGLVGLSGSFFAARRAVCAEWDTDIPSDFNTALNCARSGLKAVSDPAVVGIYPDLKDGAREYQRKRRTVIRGMAALARRAEVLDPWRYGAFAWQVWSHKPARWAVPWCLLALLPLSLLMAPRGGVYALLLWGQIAFYLAALGGIYSAGLRRYPLMRIPAFFVQANAAVGHAAVAFARGQRITRWEPSRR